MVSFFKLKNSNFRSNPVYELHELRTIENNRTIVLRLNFTLFTNDIFTDDVVKLVSYLER